MATAAKFTERYEQIEILGEGGMGIVYRAHDSNLKREVALKTIRDIQDAAAIEMFRKEVAVLAGITHPNIVDVYEVGELSGKEGKRPYFVMPLLKGVTLDKLIASSSRRLTVDRVIDIISQVCRGLQAAHDAGLVHRDLKPSNLFVLEDDSVKIIDFGVAHLIDAQSTAGLKGTLLYMAPEQVLLRKPTPQSDLFSLAVVTFVALTRRHPFDGLNRDEIAEAIVYRQPPPASDFNPAIGTALSQVIHKAMAKQPYQRFATVREFAENLQKAFRNEPMDWFNPDRVEGRVGRARKAYEQGEFGLAADILSELESEATLHPDIAPLRKVVDEAVRQRTIGQLLDTARRCFEDQEYQLALQKVQEALNLDANHTEARALKGEIENKRSSRQIEDWMRLALQHLDNYSFAHARQALQNVLNLKPKEAKAQQLLAEVDRREQEYMRLRQEKERAYQAALSALAKGELSSAMTKLERVLTMDRLAPDTVSPDRAAMYQKLYNEVRSEHDTVDNLYAEARSYMENSNFSSALAICDDMLAKYPEHACFKNLRLDAEDRQRQDRSAFVLRIAKTADAEPDLARKIQIFEDALQRCPDEGAFQRSLQSTQAKRDLVESIVTKARNLENGGQFGEAIAQWQIVREIYSPYPGLDFEVERVRKRREQKDRADAKRAWIERIDQALNTGDYVRGLDLCQSALKEFPGDAELVAVEQSAQQSLQRGRDAQQLVDYARQLVSEGKKTEAIGALWQSLQQDGSNTPVRDALVELLVSEARAKLDTDWKSAEQYLQQALDLDPGNAAAKSLRTLILDRKQEEDVVAALSEARQLQSAGNMVGALEVLETALRRYPKEQRLRQLRDNVARSLEDSNRSGARKRDLDQARSFERDAETVADADAFRTLFDQTRVLASRYSGDAEFENVVREMQSRLATRYGEPEPPEPVAPKQSPKPAKSKPAADKLKQGASAVSSAVDGLKAAFANVLARTGGKTGTKPGSWNPRQAITLGAIAIGVILLLVSLARLVIPTSAPPRVESVGRLLIQVEPAGAEYTIQDAQGKVVTDQWEKLPFGEYLIKANAPGYEPAEQRVRISAEGTTPLLVSLKLLQQALELFTNVEGASVTFDGQPVQLPDGSQFLIGNLSEAEHSLTATTKSGGKADLIFFIRKGDIPEIPILTAERLRAVAVVSFNGTIKVMRPAVSPEKVSFSLDGSEPEQLPDTGITRTGVTTGSHKLTLTYGEDPIEVPLEVPAGPKATLFLTVNQNLGYVLVDVGSHNVKIEVDGKERRARKIVGDRLVLTLEPKEYAIRITREGYEPEERKIVVRKGIQENFRGPLREIPKVAALHVRNARGAEISVGDGPWTPASGDGTLTVQVPFGEHPVRIRKPGFQVWQSPREFAAGKDVEIDAGAINFESVVARIAFAITPADATVRLTGPDGRDIPVPANRVVPLRDGKYKATVTAPNHEPREVGVDVSGGKEQKVEIALTPRKTEAAPAPVPTNYMAGWDDARNWRQGNDGWWSRQQSSRTFYKGSLGRFEFAVPCGGLFSGGCKAKMLAGYQNPQNHVEFEVDKGRVEWKIRNGSSVRPGGRNHGLKISDTLPVAIEIAPGMAKVFIFDGTWREVAAVPIPDLDLSKGRFGIDSVKNMANFRHTPR